MAKDDANQVQILNRFSVYQDIHKYIIQLPEYVQRLTAGNFSRD